MKNNLKKMKHKKIAVLIVSVAAVAAAAGIFMHLKGQKNTENAAAVSVQSAEVSRGTVANTIESSGILSIGDTTEVMVPAGLKVKEVYVEAGDLVKAGQQLASVTEASVASVMLDVNEKIEDTEDAIDDLSDDAEDTTSDEYLKKVVLEGCLEELNAEKSMLEAMQSSGVITAECDGVIASVNVSGNASSGSTADNSSSASGMSNMSSTSDDYALMTLTTDAYDAAESAAETLTADHILAVVNMSSDSGSTSASETDEDADSSGDESADSKPEGGTDEPSSSATIISIGDLSSLSVAIPKAGEAAQVAIPAGSNYTGTISWDPNGVFEAGKTYTATVTLTANQGYAFSTAADYSMNVAGANPSQITPVILGGENVEGNSLQIRAVFKTEENKNTTGSNNNSQNYGSLYGNSGAAQGSMGGSYYVGGISASTGSSSSSSESSGFDTSAYEISTASAFSIVSGDQVHVTVDVDELDINSVEDGQNAEITLDALEGQTFEGTISRVSDAASSSNGGNTKYAVEITTDKADGMKSGMSASVTINVEESENALVIPINALQEMGDQTFVYTKEEADGTLSGETEVEVGLSNGSLVEITSGLNEGDTVYFTKIASDNDSMDMSGFMGGMTHNGDRPSDMPGGEMSSGGFGGGQGGGPGGKN